MVNIAVQRNTIIEFGKIVLLIILLAVLFWPALVKLVNAWDTKPQSSHGYFILPICLWMCWQKKDEISATSIVTTYKGFVFLIPGLVLHFFAVVTAFDTLANIALLVTLAGIIIGLWGLELFKVVLFPFLFLIFMFPIPDVIYLSLTNPLKILATKLSAIATVGVGIPTLQEGNLLHFATFQLEVVEACSGMRSLMTYLMLSTLLVYITSYQHYKKVILLLSAIPIAIFINVFRITLTAVLARSYGTEVAMGFFHGFAGIIVFIIGFGLLLGVSKILSKLPV